MVLQDLLTNKDDYLRASRALLREIVKQTKHEINFQAFCLGLMQERKEPQYLDMEFKVCHRRPSARGGRAGSPLLLTLAAPLALLVVRRAQWLAPTCAAAGPTGQHGVLPARGPGRGWLGAPRGVSSLWAG